MKKGEENALWSLFRWADSSFPIGGYAYSSGLEAVVQNGFIKSMEQFRSYLEMFLGQIGSSDLPFINSIYTYRNDRNKWVEIFRFYGSMLNIPSLRNASIAQGKAWIRIHCNNNSPEQEFNSEEYISRNNLEPFLVLLMAVTASIKNIEKLDISRLWMFTILRDQLSAAVRLGLFGPMEAQKVMDLGMETSELLLEQFDQVEFQDAARSDPMPDMAALCHKSLYSRLFQN